MCFFILCNTSLHVCMSHEAKGNVQFILYVKKKHFDWTTTRKKILTFLELLITLINRNQKDEVTSASNVLIETWSLRWIRTFINVYCQIYTYCAIYTSTTIIITVDNNLFIISSFNMCLSAKWRYLYFTWVFLSCYNNVTQYCCFLLHCIYFAFLFYIKKL